MSAASHCVARNCHALLLLPLLLLLVVVRGLTDRFAMPMSGSMTWTSWKWAIHRTTARSLAAKSGADLATPRVTQQA